MRPQKSKLLNGTWKYIKDQNDSLNLEDVKKALLSNEVGFLKIPSNWYLTEIGDYSGTIWFLSEFEYVSSGDELVILQFDGVDYFCEVYLNDVYLGEHEGYFQRFYFDISHVINSGSNLLVVKVNSPREDTTFSWPNRKKLIKGIFSHHDCRPGGWDPEHGQDRNTGGIWNNVMIYVDKVIYISNFKVYTKILYEQKRAFVNFEIDYVLNSSITHKTLEVSIKHRDKTVCNRKIKVSQIKNGKLYFTAEILDVHLWFPYEIGEPELYQIEISTEEEIIFRSHFGIREVELKNSIFYINNRRFFLRGTNIIPEQMLSNLTAEKIESLINLLKEANINIVRVHAHVNRKELYDAFDQAGILVWQDFALQWEYDDSEDFISNAVEQIKDMVNQLHYHPSIVFWCCHNEPGEQINKLDEFLYNAIQSGDNTRIIRKASNFEEHCYEGWYWGDYRNYVAAPMGPLVTEFGAQALPVKKSFEKFIPESESKNPESKIWAYHNFQYEQTFNIAKIDKGNSIDEFIENSQTYQATLLKEAIHYYRRKKYNSISGIFQFMFIDCWESISWSVIDYYGEKKKGFNALKDAFNPILLSVNLRQFIYSYRSKKLNLELWIINDFHRELNNLILIFWLNEREFHKMKVPRVEKDSLLHFPFVEIEVPVPEFLSKGFYKLRIDLRDEDLNLISHVEFDMEFNYD